MFEFENLVADSPMKVPGTDYLTLSSAGQVVGVPSSMTLLDLPLKWLVRTKGSGTLLIAPVLGSVTNPPVSLVVEAPDWIWQTLAIPAGSGVAGVGAVVGWGAGAVALDAIILAAGDWVCPAPGESVEWPASAFFHAGYSDPGNQSVTLRAKVEPSSIVFYGPKLPLDAGLYAIELVFESPAAAGTDLGQFNIRWRGDETQHWTPVVAGGRALSQFKQNDNRPFFLAFQFARNADITISKVVLTRVK
jgi:hypothetical protein